MTTRVLFCAVLAACAATPPDIVLDDTLRFGSVDVAPGIYGVARQDDAHLKLLPDDGPAVVVKAVTGEHAESEGLPAAHLLGGDAPSERHVVLLLDGGASLEAVGYVDGVQPRGRRRFYVKKPQRLKTVIATTVRPVVSAPRGGARLKPGGRTTIRWQGVPRSYAYVSLHLYRGSRHVQAIHRRVRNTGKFPWTVPDVAAGTDYRIALAGRPTRRERNVPRAFSQLFRIEVPPPPAAPEPEEPAEPDWKGTDHPGPAITGPREWYYSTERIYAVCEAAPNEVLQAAIALSQEFGVVGVPALKYVAQMDRKPDFEHARSDVSEGTPGGLAFQLPKEYYDKPFVYLRARIQATAVGYETLWGPTRIVEVQPPLADRAGGFGTITLGPGAGPFTSGQRMTVGTNVVPASNPDAAFNNFVYRIMNLSTAEVKEWTYGPATYTATAPEVTEETEFGVWAMKYVQSGSGYSPRLQVTEAVRFTVKPAE